MLRQMLHTLGSSAGEERTQVAEAVLQHMAFQAVPMDQAQNWTGAVPWDLVLHFVLQYIPENPNNSVTAHTSIIQAFLGL